MRAQIAAAATLAWAALLVSNPVIAQAGKAKDAAAKKPAQQQDWPTLVKKANTHRRVMLRRAISRKVAQAGDAAVPAIRAYQKANGRNAASVVAVDAMNAVTTEGA